MDAARLADLMGNMPGVDYAALLPGFLAACETAQINSPRRMSMWCAQLGHESGGLRWMEEIADGTAYEWRADLGNTQPGDGRRYKGRGPIQLTGRSNYRAFTKWANNGIDFEAEPWRLSEPHWGFQAAAHYWTVARPRLNEYADNGDLEAATRAINGGLNGLDDRRERYRRALRILEGGSILEKVLDYPRSQVTQETYYNCGPASSQTIIAAATGVMVSEGELARELGTTTNGTNHIGLFPPVLNAHIPGAQYVNVHTPRDPMNADEKEAFWRNLTSSINAGFGVVVNIVAPPNNYPRAVPPSTVSPNYRGGTIYHYVACMGWADDGMRRVWIADSGFSPFGYWLSFDQLATLVTPKGYVYAANRPKEEDEDMTPEQGAALHDAKINAMEAKAGVERLEQKVDLILDQLVGPERDENGWPKFTGWKERGAFPGTDGLPVVDWLARKLKAVK